MINEIIEVERLSRSVPYRGNYRGGILTVVDRAQFRRTPDERNWAVDSPEYEQWMNMRKLRVLELCRAVFGGFVPDEERGDDMDGFYATRLSEFGLLSIRRTERGVEERWRYETLEPYTD
jgi:hypothetical protein